jgi:heavy metal sensor kinase
MNSIRLRLVFGFTAILAVALTGFASLFYHATTRWIMPDILGVARDKVVRFGRWVNPEPLRPDNFLDTAIRNEAQGYYWAVFDPKGTLVQKSRLIPEVFPLPEMPEATKNGLEAHSEMRRGVDGAAYAVAWYPVLVQLDGRTHFRITGWAEAVVPMQPFEARVAQLRLWLIACGAGTLVLTSALAWYLSGLWLRPWRVVAETSRRLAEADVPDAQLPVPDDDEELATVTRAFNQLIERVKLVHARQHQFIADASHEVRTPLSSLRAEIEVSLRRERTPADYHRTLECSRQELERLSTLVENLLALAALDASQPQRDKAPVDLAIVCRDVVEQLAPLAAAQNVRLQLELSENVIIPGDVFSLERMVRNVVENALHHTPAGEQIVILAGVSGKEARIEVIDAGVGIAPEHLPHLFDRFYRVDTARTRTHGGAGLGLSIVKAIVTAHGGTVSVASKLGAGSTFTLRLPMPS